MVEMQTIAFPRFGQWQRCSEKFQAHGKYSLQHRFAMTDTDKENDKPIQIDIGTIFMPIWTIFHTKYLFKN